ncbi:hypothetical protein NPIL_43691 [Nephila pilipes]|uniref:Uncharacterized protein n=1 Tax=Nephila pilipes TaxID=299642 RepID=A0A8X6NXH4_NEPPI|nr:hypothetical protein NPIL_43691 [Nephila pilipes]
MREVRESGVRNAGYGMELTEHSLAHSGGFFWKRGAGVVKGRTKGPSSAPLNPVGLPQVLPFVFLAVFQRPAFALPFERNSFMGSSKEGLFASATR